MSPELGIQIEEITKTPNPSLVGKKIKTIPEVWRAQREVLESNGEKILTPCVNPETGDRCPLYQPESSINCAAGLEKMRVIPGMKGVVCRETRDDIVLMDLTQNDQNQQILSEMSIKGNEIE